MKSLSTVVQDVYSLLSKPIVLTVEQAEELGARITDVLKEQLTKPREQRGLSMSSLGTECKRKLWYQVNVPEKAEPLPPHARLNYLTGHILEEVALGLIEAAEHKVDGRQTVLQVEGVEGHRDAVVDSVVVDVKSANSRSIEKFKYHKLDTDDPFGYRTQLDLYLEGSQDDELVKVKKEAAFIAIDKELGHIYLDRYPKRDIDYKKLVKDVRDIVNSTDVPARGYRDEPFNKSGNMQLGTACKYCPFKEHCWSDANNGAGLRKFIYSYGPVWLTKVVKDPNVFEI